MESAVASDHPRQRPPPLYKCPTPPQSIVFPTYWYRLPDNDNFLICTRCYEDKLSGTSCANVLRCDFLDFGSRSNATCDFNTPRIDSLLRQAVALNDFSPLWSFAVQRLEIESCPDTVGIKSGNNVKWFKPINEMIPGFMCCEACYEDVVLATTFRANFVSNAEQQPTDRIWPCDLAVPYLRQRLQAYAQGGDWHGFVQASRHRMSLPECVSATPTFAYTMKWYNTVNPSPIPGMTLCEACYLDRVGWQEDMVPHFAQVTVRPDDLNSRFICDFQVKPMNMCSDLLLSHGMFEKWHHFASLTMSKPRCNEEGIIDGEWHGLADPKDATRDIKDIDICAACHASWNQSADLGHLFRRLIFPSGTLRLCSLNSSAPQHSDYVDNWNQLYFTRDPAPFIDYFSRFASLSNCQGSRRLENALWYGDKAASLLICPWCFEEAVRGTLFSSTFSLQNTRLADGYHCSLYSPRMRDKYAQACKQRSLDSFLSFAVHREQIYQQINPQLEVYYARQRHNMELLKIASRSRAFSVQAASLRAGFTGGYPIVTHGDLSIVPQTAIYQHQLRKLELDPQRPAMMQLEAMWKEVE